MCSFRQRDLSGWLNLVYGIATERPCPDVVTDLFLNKVPGVVENCILFIGHVIGEVVHITSHLFRCEVIIIPGLFNGSQSHDKVGRDRANGDVLCFHDVRLLDC